MLSDSIAMLRRTPSTTPDSPFCTAFNVPVTGCLPGAFQAGLWKCCTGRPTDPPSTPPTVCTERCSTADLSYENRGPHHWRAYHSSLAARPSADRLQGRRDDLQGSTWNCIRRDTWDRCHLSPTYLVGGHCALPVPVVFWCHQSDCQLLAAGPSISLVPVFGTCCRRRSRQHSLCRCSVSVSRHSSSRNHILMLFYEAETLSSVDLFTATFYIFVLVFFFISVQPRSSSAI